jgi:hypothetical protein
MSTDVQIRGDGVAGRCCAHLLAGDGFGARVESAERTRLPVILLSEPAQGLISDVFGTETAFQGLPRIRKRVVAWGGARPVAVAHSAVVISEEQLLGRLVGGYSYGRTADPTWTAYAVPPLPRQVVARRFGTRNAVAMAVRLKAEAEREACWMEALPEGWLFLVTIAPGSGWLLACGTEPAKLAESSSLVRAQIDSVGVGTREFAASPRIASPLAEGNWLACGTAAIGFDPICGDGTAHAVREGILAAAVIKAAIRGGDAAALIDHYRNRLLAGFLRHLLHCVEYYSAGPGGGWWEGECDAARRGIEWCSREMGGDPRFRYRLKGFDLEETGAAQGG